jgi:hypothetical protein
MAPMRLRGTLCTALALFAWGCGRPSAAPVPTLTLLSRQGCMMTGALQVNLDAALRQLGTPLTYTVIDLGTLPPTDRRVAYPTPTLLVNDRDLFGLPVPAPPFPEPT